MLLSLAASQLLRLTEGSERSIIGYNIILAHKQTLMWLADAQHKVSFAIIKEASAIFQLFVLVVSVPEQLSPELRKDLTQLSLHTWHGLVHRVSFLAAPG